MTPIPSHDLLRTVEEYIRAVTPEQFKQDLDKSNFDLYNGIGEKVDFKNSSCNFLGIMYEY